MVLLHSFSFTNRIKHIYTHISTICHLSYTYNCASSNDFINKTVSHIQVSEKQAAGFTNTHSQ